MSTDGQLDELIKEVRLLLAKGKLEKAILMAEKHFAEGPAEILNNLTLFKAQIHNLNADDRAGVITNDEKEADQNKISQNFLGYITNPSSLTKIKIEDGVSPSKESSAYPSPTTRKPELVNVLSGKYWNMNDIARFAQDSDVGPQNITLTDDAKTAWHELITEAGNNQLWEDLKKLLLEDNKRDQKMIDMLNGYQPKDLFS